MCCVWSLLWKIPKIPFFKDEGEVKEEMGFGGLNPMEATATLLILSKIAYMSKVSFIILLFGSLKKKEATCSLIIHF